MSFQKLSTISGHLMHAKVAPDDMVKRSRIAAAIQNAGQYFDDSAVVSLRAHFASGYVGLALEEAVEQVLLDGSWKGVVDEAREKARAAADDAKRVEADASGIEFVTEANPYGWARVEAKRGQDHDVPGAWNPFRQTFNLTAGERSALGTRDHRRRGCSRYEVLGASRGGAGWRPGTPVTAAKDDRLPKPHFDADEVELAKERERGAPVNAPEREVYGA